MRALLWSLCCLVSLAHPDGAGAEEVSCPRQISPSVIAINNVPPPWTGSLSDHPLELTGVNFSDGPPSEMAFLKEEYSHEDQKSLVSKQSFYRYPSQKGAYWLTCEYGAQAVSLSKEIPRGINECTVSYDKPKTGLYRYRFRSLTCK